MGYLRKGVLYEKKKISLAYFVPALIPTINFVYDGVSYSNVSVSGIPQDTPNGASITVRVYPKDPTVCFVPNNSFIFYGMFLFFALILFAAPFVFNLGEEKEVDTDNKTLEDDKYDYFFKKR